MTARRAARTIAAGLAAIVSWLSLAPKPPAPPGLPSGSDLVAHLAMHLALAAALRLSFTRPAPAAALALAFAVGLELGQTLSPGRHVSAADLAANLAGAAMGWAIARRRART